MKEKSSELCMNCIKPVFSCFGIKKIQNSNKKEAPDYDDGSALELEAFPKNGRAIIFRMEELNKATSNFSPSCKIGQGGFGIVYKGKLQDGTLVAIKRARKDVFESQISSQFQSEVNMLASVEHLNLVKLIGYLERGNERILVEEYVPNGNLRQHLDREYKVVLDFNTRLDIAIDIAHALTYLHLYADQPIIHRDVKASNILLTESFRAKVADFGFSRVGPSGADVTHVSTQVKGTVGYLDPEYLKTYKLTTKSDVYAFGILLVEILSGRRPIEQARQSDERITVRWGYRHFMTGDTAVILDPLLEKTTAVISVAEKIFQIAFRCCAPKKEDRPNMNRVAEHLWDIRRDHQTLGHGGKTSEIS